MFAVIVDGVFSAVKYVFDWIVGLGMGILNAFLSEITDKMPELHTSLDSVAVYCSWANKWVAIDYGFSLFSAWMTIAGIIIATNLSMRLIPFLK